MHLKLTTARSGGKTYRYALLVQSVRGADGKPTHKIIANLGDLEPQVIANIKAALGAARGGKPVVIAEPDQTTKFIPVPIAKNLSFLNVMAVLETWAHWQLPQLLNRILERDHDDVPAASIVASLVAHRCIEPGSKLSAVSWFPETCLPEFLPLAPAQFNNSRVHRVLSSLETALPSLQNNLPLLFQSFRGKPSALFLDVTDVYFEGRGPNLAEHGRTKEGLRNRRKIGVVLMCDRSGFPLRWSVTPGKRDDKTCMCELIDQLQGALWLGDAPIVCDRAMGQASGVDKLLRSGFRFLVAIPRNEVDSYKVDIPTAPFDDLEPASDHDPNEEDLPYTDSDDSLLTNDIATASATAIKAGLTQVANNLFVLDLGISQRPLVDGEVSWIGPNDVDPTSLVGAASMIAWARIFRRVLDCRQVRNQADIAAITGVSRARVTEIMNLLGLATELQDELIAGAFGAVPERAVRQIVQHKTLENQRAELLRLQREQQLSVSSPAHMRAKKLKITTTHAVRCTAYFNPEMFVAQRLHDRKLQRNIDEFVDKLNSRLRSPHCRLDENTARAELITRLARDHVVSLYEICLHHQEQHHRKVPQFNLVRNDKQWARRRKYHGFVLLVGHRDLPYSAAELAQLYRDKDTVEKDFRLIKSVTEMRPLFHRTDPKVRAHVAICMLALLVERAIETRLQASGIHMTASACLEHLKPFHLNVYERHELLDSLYSATRIAAEHRPLIQALGLEPLTRDQEILGRIQPR